MEFEGIGTRSSGGRAAPHGRRARRAPAERRQGGGGLRAERRARGRGVGGAALRQGRGSGGAAETASEEQEGTDAERGHGAAWDEPLVEDHHDMAIGAHPR